MTYRPTIASLHADVVELRKEVTDLSDAMKAQTAATKELVDAWKAGRALVTFIKWSSTVVTAVGVLWAAIRYGVWPSS